MLWVRISIRARCTTLCLISNIVSLCVSLWICYSSTYMYFYYLDCLNRLDISVKVGQWLAAGQWLSLGTPVYPTNKTDHHDITEILLKVALNTNKQTLQHLPGYGNTPRVIISVSNIPNDHTSDLIVYIPESIDSGAVHLTGKWSPSTVTYSSSSSW
jgi:hypothetical protein